MKLGLFKCMSVKYSGPWSEACYDDQTEVLTYDGWKFFKDLIYQDRLATLNDNHQLEYQNPTQIISNDYDGGMYHLSWPAVKINLLVTDKHKLYVGRQKKDKTAEWKLEAASEGLGKTRYYKKNVEWLGEERSVFLLPEINIEVNIKNQYGATAIQKRCWPEKKIPMDTWLRFLGYFISEGSATRNHSDYYIQIRQCKKEHQQEIYDLMKQISEKVYVVEEGTRFLIRDKQLYTYLKKLGKCNDKFIPREFFDLSKRQLLILYQALMNGDGNQSDGCGSTYFTSSKRLADDFQELLLKVGMSGSIRNRAPAGTKWKILGREGVTRYDSLVIHVRKKNNTPLKCTWGKSNKGFIEKIVSYSGKIYCAEVPNHTLYVRRNGCPVWCGNSGYAQANRNIIQSLHEVGVDLVTELQVYANHKTNYGAQFDVAKSYQNKHSNYKVKVLHITPNVYAKHKEVGKYHIGHLFWETTKMSPNWAWYLNEVREIWTGCEENVKTFRDMGFEGKIFKFPQPLDTDRVEYSLPVKNARGFVFGSVFQWIERKDPKSLLTAYWKEFEHDKDVTLVIKTYGLGFEKHESEKIYRQIDEWKQELGQASYPNTLIIDYLLSDKEIHQFYESCDCIVSAHRFEGWGVTQAEALVHGKPLISTKIGGVHEWISDSAYFPVTYKLVDVFGMDWAEQYTVPGNKWAQVDINDLRQKMRHVYENRDEARKVGLQGQKEVRENFNFKKVGEMMKHRLAEIYKEQGLS